MVVATAAMRETFGEAGLQMSETTILTFGKPNIQDGCWYLDSRQVRGTGDVRHVHVCRVLGRLLTDALSPADATAMSSCRRETMKLDAPLHPRKVCRANRAAMRSFRNVYFQVHHGRCKL
jgi:hypothetical protein